MLLTLAIIFFIILLVVSYLEYKKSQDFKIIIKKSLILLTIFALLTSIIFFSIFAYLFNQNSIITIDDEKFLFSDNFNQEGTFFKINLDFNPDRHLSKDYYVVSSKDEDNNIIFHELSRAILLEIISMDNVSEVKNIISNSQKIEAVYFYNESLNEEQIQYMVDFYERKVRTSFLFEEDFNKQNTTFANAIKFQFMSEDFDRIPRMLFSQINKGTLVVVPEPFFFRLLRVFP